MSIDGGLHKLFREHLPPGVHWERVENLLSTGMPDTNYCFSGVEGWIEYKNVTRGWRVKFRPTQPGWIGRRARAGGRVYIAVRRIDDLYIFLGLRAMELATNRLDCVTCELHETGGVRNWDWQKVKSLILQR